VFHKHYVYELSDIGIRMYFLPGITDDSCGV
jgi:hypothetical protein